MKVILKMQKQNHLGIYSIIINQLKNLENKMLINIEDTSPWFF